MAHIIFLHGASSSGKSTLARALRDRLNQPFWHISIDHLRDSGVLPLERFNSGEFDWKSARAPFFNGFHASLRAYADAGNNLILEHILDTPGWKMDLQRLLKNHDVFFVGLHCPLHLLKTREHQRADRPAGSAENDFHAIHIGCRYDLELHAQDNLEDNVQTLLQAWKSGKRHSDFSQT